MPATITIGSDRYSAKVVAVSPSGQTVTVLGTGNRETMTYRWSKAQGRFRSGVSYGLRLGTAEDYRDPSF